MHDADGELEAAGEVCADACGPGIEFPLGSPSSREEGGVGPRAAESRRRGAEGAKAGGGGGAGILDQEGQFWLSDAMRHNWPKLSADDAAAVRRICAYRSMTSRSLSVLMHPLLSGFPPKAQNALTMSAAGTSRSK